jgi:hypothetical protein
MMKLMPQAGKLLPHFVSTRWAPTGEQETLNLSFRSPPPRRRILPNHPWAFYHRTGVRPRFASGNFAPARELDLQ